MIWFFTREGRHLNYEIRREASGNGYELVVTFADGSERIEQVADAGALLERSLALQRHLMEQGWLPPGADLRTLFAPEPMSPPLGMEPAPAQACPPATSFLNGRPAAIPTSLGRGRRELKFSPMRRLAQAFDYCTHLMGSRGRREVGGLPKRPARDPF